MRAIPAILSFLILTVLGGCTKPEGEGGTSAIYGKVYEYNYDGSGALLGKYYLEDEDVFIIYGDEDNYYDDSYNTTFDGSFRFQYLRQGTYTVFVYSDCDTCASGTEAMSRTVEITGNNQDMVLDDFEIRKDKGGSAIRGKVYAYDYNSLGVLTGEYYLADEDVFIIYGDEDSYYDDSYETSFDGSFRFQNLSRGIYTVFVYSDCDTCASGTEAISRTVEITGNGQDIVLDDLVVRK